MKRRTRQQLIAELKKRGIEIKSLGPSAKPDKIARAARELAQEIPPTLQEIYRAFNGLRGTTNAGFLWPLFGDQGMVPYNTFIRQQEFSPSWISDVIFFGGNGIGDYWGINVKRPSKVLAWRPIDGEEFEIAGRSIIDVWEKEQHSYESLE
ncbi:MAG TPA: SMI1/KNR4 family protein [Humisphaera sp.]|jgi:hypothetical protein|nr:SMI1/KNR4 family protein [Humisphaera sp.]